MLCYAMLCYVPARLQAPAGTSARRMVTSEKLPNPSTSLQLVR
jgi:hypothetical protein